MATATLQTRTRLHKSVRTCSRQMPEGERTNPQVSTAQVKDMLREIAFVLQATRKISQEIRDGQKTAQ